MKILIVGAGDIGFQLSKQLSQDKHDITMVEADPQKVRRAREQLDAIVIEGRGESLRGLKEADIDHTDILAAMTDSDGVNLIACMYAKKLGVRGAIARVRNPELADEECILESDQLGADLIIHPERETANAIVRLLRQSSATDIVEFADGKIELLGIRLEADSPLLGIRLVDLARQYGNPPMRIVAITRYQDTVIPKGDSKLHAGDQIFIVCDPDYVSEFLRISGKTNVRIENIMILGGGLIGQFVASTLGKSANVKIIESSEAKSEEIADILPHTLIIHGDGTDIDLLATEGIVDMDAFIAVTGHDETNIITTLVAGHMLVPRTIGLVNKVEYLPITTKIGMDAVVSKQLLTVNAVQQYIQRQVASIASLPGIQAQLIEYIASGESKITRKPLKDVRFPKHALVGAVLHNEELVIPKGDTRIQPGDKVVVFSMPDALEEVEKLFN
ncbi:MAG: Trk system potassium transporter TrkA [Candidatus Latescibacterota bacterium]|nr:MAG: Trk system potassium transporter TrkA [Candidatus Latescibacterota bacterium]